MAKLLEKDGAEMMAALVSIATPIKRLMDDDEFSAAWKEATKKGLRTGMTDVLKIYVDIVPLLLGDKHLNDTMQILAVIEGTTVKALLKKKGTELLSDVVKAFDEQIKPFFSLLSLSVGVKP